MSSREAFEAWVDSNFPFKKDRFDLFRGEYKSQFTKQLWQSWQASREGLDAKLKSAENNDVDARFHVAELEAKCAALAAENAGLREYRPQPSGAAMMEALDAFYEYHEDVPEQGMMAAFEILCCKRPKIPATDTFLAEVRSQGVEMFASSLKVAGGGEHPYSTVANEFAAKLRQEAAQ
ncbi:hypothetical protein [Enterobacter sichuanensis]|uniref:hypothetical protein n=1 Tax=Enterobacter sichuanensis TaxID=2071710 RepID=UPI00192E50F2|nr:hypothetical protein [Enterobacter sichuanensis]